MTAPTPERIALAYARNWFNDARRFPKDAAIDAALLLFVVLMLAGFQFQLVSKFAEELRDSLPRVVTLLPLAAALLTLFVARANPVLVRRAAIGNWLDTLPVSPHSKAICAVRKSCYAALLVSSLFFVLCIDLQLLPHAPSVNYLTLALLLFVPPAVVLVRSALRWSEILEPHELTEVESVRQKANLFRRVIPQKFSDMLARGLVNMALSEKSAANLWITAASAGAILLLCVVFAIREDQPFLLLIGAALVPMFINAGLEPAHDKLYAISRSLPLKYRTFVRSHAKTSVMIPSLFALPLVLATPFVSDGGYWCLAVLASIIGVAVLLFVKLLISLAFPHSKISQTLFTFAAALGVGIFSMQAPLIAPAIGLIACVVWLMERGWGVWEFGYGERTR